MPIQKPPTPRETLDRVKTLRTYATDAEKLVWAKLRNRQLSNLKFRRQHSVPPYIVDFYCEDRLLIIELDGGQHNEEVDKRRTDFLAQKGYRVLRYWNNDVLANIEGVMEDLMNKINSTLSNHPSPNPLPEGEGLEKL